MISGVPSPEPSGGDPKPLSRRRLLVAVSTPRAVLAVAFELEDRDQLALVADLHTNPSSAEEPWATTFWPCLHRPVRL